MTCSRRGSTSLKHEVGKSLNLEYLQLTFCHILVNLLTVYDLVPPNVGHETVLIF